MPIRFRPTRQPALPDRKRGFAPARVMFLAGMSMSLGACTDFHWPGQPAPAAPDAGAAARADRPDEVDPSDDSVFDRPMRRVLVNFNVLRVSAADGAFTRTDAIWQIAKGALPDADMALHLQDNGFRAAVGQDSDREPLRKWLERAAEVRTGLDQVTPNEARLVDIDVGPADGVQSLFHIDRSGRLHGEQFTNASAKFRMAYEIRSTRVEEVSLQMMPELEEPPGAWKWVITDQGATQVQEQRKHAYRDLVIEAKIPPGGFLLLGPTADIHAQPLVGRPFFSEQWAAGDKGSVVTRESIYIISPIAVQVDESGTSAAGRPERSR